MAGRIKTEGNQHGVTTDVEDFTELGSPFSKLGTATIYSKGVTVPWHDTEKQTCGVGV